MVLSRRGSDFDLAAMFATRLLFFQMCCKLFLQRKSTKQSMCRSLDRYWGVGPERGTFSEGTGLLQGGLSVVVRAFRRRSRQPVECHKPRQSPAPGFGEKYWSLSGFPSHSLESGGGAFLTVIFGQILAYSAFSDSHFSSPGSLSALIASTGHSGSQTPQSMHSSG